MPTQSRGHDRDRQRHKTCPHPAVGMAPDFHPPYPEEGRSVLRRVTGLLVPLLFLPAACAPGGPQAKSRPSQPEKSEDADRLQALQREVQKAQSEILDKYRK